MENNSPRLDVVWVDKKYTKLSENCEADIVVIGWGIAWCMTAYFLLHTTDKKVMLLEGEEIAHGATGHNGWQIDVYFEKGIKELIVKYGEAQTKDAYEAMLDAREKLEEIISVIQRQGQYVKYIGYNVYKAEHQIFDACEHLSHLEKLWLEINELFVKDTVPFRDEISKKYHEQINWISEDEGNKYLWTTHLDRAWFEATHYGTLNAAALCYALIEYLLLHYSDRFKTYEHTLVSNIIPYDHSVSVQTNDGWTAHAKDVILCTNAYRSYLINQQDDCQDIKAIRWYMAGYFVVDAKAPLTICYQPQWTWYLDEYYYQTARQFSTPNHKEQILVSLWWPDKNIGPSQRYPQVYKDDLDRYIKEFYKRSIEGTYYRWWDMWYTDTWLRKIWTHPQHTHVRYNVGCNGVGILWSIHWGRKIAQLMTGKSMKESVFDIK